MLRLALGPHGMLTTPRLADAAGRRSRSANAQQFAQISDALRLQQVQHLLPYSGREERVGQRVVRVLHVEAVLSKKVPDGGWIIQEITAKRMVGQDPGIWKKVNNPKLADKTIDY